MQFTLVFVCSAALLAAHAMVVSGVARTPNIIHIMADDLGWNDVGFHNSKIISPHMNWLADNGIELTNYYNQISCSPSRSAVMTGKYPSNNGFQHFILQENAKSCLPLEHKLLPQYFKDHGYTTKYLGKWHLGYCNTSCLPTSRGFDEYRGTLSSIAGYKTWSNGGIMFNFDDDKTSFEDYPLHQALHEKQLVREMITSHEGNEEPLFFFVSPTAPNHVAGTKEFIVTKEMFDVHNFLNASDYDERHRREYLGLVSSLDDIVGEVIASLKDADMFDDTIIVFTSDNGGHSIPLPLPDDMAYGNNYPLRHGKGGLFEGSTRAPTIFYDTKLDKSNRGTKRDFLMHITDWLPTYMDIVSDFSEVIDGLDGISQVHNFLTKYSDDTHKYWLRQEFLVQLDSLFQLGDTECAVTDGAYRYKDYKLIYGKHTGVPHPPFADQWPIPAESKGVSPVLHGDSCTKRDENGKMVSRCLFNVKDDPSELVDLYDDPAYEDIRQTMLEKINHYKEISVQNVFKTRGPADPSTTNMVGGMLVPRTDFCNPPDDFPLEPQNPNCVADLTGETSSKAGKSKKSKKQMSKAKTCSK